jgi:hypothetical protein
MPEMHVYQNGLEEKLEVIVSRRSINNGSSVKTIAKHEYQQMFSSTNQC